MDVSAVSSSTPSSVPLKQMIAGSTATNTIGSISSDQLHQLVDIVNNADGSFGQGSQAQARGILLTVDFQSLSQDDYRAVADAAFNSPFAKSVQALQAAQQAAISGTNDTTRPQAQANFVNNLSSSDQSLFFD